MYNSGNEIWVFNNSFSVRNLIKLIWNTYIDGLIEVLYAKYTTIIILPPILFEYFEAVYLCASNIQACKYVAFCNCSAVMGVLAGAKRDTSSYMFSWTSGCLATRYSKNTNVFPNCIKVSKIYWKNSLITYVYILLYWYYICNDRKTRDFTIFFTLIIPMKHVYNIRKNYIGVHDIFEKKKDCNKFREYWLGFQIYC